MIGAGLIDRANDRKPLADWVRNRIKPQVDVFIDTAHIPPLEGWDIVPRVKYIVKEAKRLGIDFLYLIENDDYYPTDYISRMESARQDADFINSYLYPMYHIKDKLLMLTGHKKGRFLIGGLWTMGFRPGIVGNYFWQRIKDDIRNLDGELSMFAQSIDSINDVWFNDHNGVAIKGHGVGLFKKTGPHQRFILPYMIDDVSKLSMLTDRSFVELHGLVYREHTKTNEELRAELKQIFRIDEDFIGQLVGSTEVGKHWPSP